MIGRDWRPLARSTATRAFGLVALSGITAMGASAKVHSTTPPVTTSVSFSADLQVRMPSSFATGLRVKGEADFVHHAAALTILLPSIGLHGSDLGKPGILPGSKPVTLTARWVENHAYMEVPAALSALAGGVRDMSVPVPASTATQIDTDLNQTAVALTYAHLLVNALAAHQTQHHRAPRTIDGVAVTGTEVELTLSQLLKVIPSLSPAMNSESKALGNQTVPVTVWVDHAGRLVELAMTSASRGNVTSISGTVHFSGYDVPLNITAPSSSVVTALPAGLRQFLNGLFGL